MRLAFCLSLHLLALHPHSHPSPNPTSVPCRRKFTHLIRVPHQTRTLPLSLTAAALEASVVTILNTSVASLLPCFFFSPHSAKRWRHQLAGGASVCFRGGEGDPRLHRCGPLSAAGSIPGPSAASSAPLQAKQRCVQNQICRFSHPAARFRGG